MTFEGGQCAWRHATSRGMLSLGSLRANPSLDAGNGSSLPSRKQLLTCSASHAQRPPGAQCNHTSAASKPLRLATRTAARRPTQPYPCSIKAPEEASKRVTGTWPTQNTQPSKNRSDEDSTVDSCFVCYCASRTVTLCYGSGCLVPRASYSVSVKLILPR